MIEIIQKNKFFFSLLVMFFSSMSLPVLADIKVIVNDDLITTMDIKEGLKAKLARSKEVNTALKKRFQSSATKARWREMVMAERPASKAEAQKLQRKLVQELKRDITRKFRPKMRKAVLQDLIDQRLKYQAAKKNNMLMSESDINKLMKQLANKNKNPQTGKPLTLKQFKRALKAQGVNFKKLKQGIRIRNSWQRYVNSKFRRQVSVTDKEIQKMLSKQSPSKVQKTTSAKPEEKILKVSFVFANKSSEAGKSKRVVEADAFRKIVSTCRKITQKAALSSNVEIKYLKNGMKYAKIRNALKDRKGGQLSAPVLFNDFVALYVKCGTSKTKKSNGTADAAKRRKVENFLKMKAIARLAKKHLRDLRQDANIEYR